MKKITSITKKIAFVLLTLTLTTSCEGWLDIRPQTEIMAYDLFQSEEGFWDALNGIYIGMTRETLYGANLSWGAIEFMAWQHTGNFNSDARWYDLQRFNFEAINPRSFINGAWAGLYNVISEINFLLFALEEWGQDVLPLVAYRTIKGEILALRAFLHFDLIRLFAPGNLANNPQLLDVLVIPYVTEHTKQITPLRSYRETLDLLMADLNQGIYYLAQVPMPDRTFMTGGPPFSMNLLAALHLRARVVQWQNPRYTYAYAREVIGILPEFAPHIGWFTGSGSREWPSELLWCLDVFNLRRFMQNAYTTHIGASGNLGMLTNTTEFVNINLFELGEPFGVSPADFRFRYWFQDFDASELLWQHGRLSVKVRQPAMEPGVARGTDIIPMMRISELYLMVAESLIGVDNDRALYYINYLRTRRNNPDPIPAGVTEDDLRHILVQEYRREFSQEGQLFFLYKRLGIERIPGMPLPLGVMTNERYTLPFPLSEQEFRGM